MSDSDPVEKDVARLGRATTRRSNGRNDDQAQTQDDAAFAPRTNEIVSRRYPGSGGGYHRIQVSNASITKLGDPGASWGDPAE